MDACAGLALSAMATPVGPYTPAYRVGDLLFISGQIGLDGADLVDGFTAQTNQALANLRDLLAENGLSMDDVVKTTVFVTDMDNYVEMNELYLAAFGDHRPARSAVAVAALPKGAQMEIEAIAYVG
jgi:2-iminobutanoate/2-iminopropanoate deaminase